VFVYMRAAPNRLGGTGRNATQENTPCPRKTKRGVQCTADPLSAITAEGLAHRHCTADSLTAIPAAADMHGQHLLACWYAVCNAKGGLQVFTTEGKGKPVCTSTRDDLGIKSPRCVWAGGGGGCWKGSHRLGRGDVHH
jgi:hypothetical protein